MQEVGLRILLALGSCDRPECSAPALPVGGGALKKDVGVAREGRPCDDLQEEAQLGFQTPREDSTAVRRRNSVKQGHSDTGHAQCCAQPEYSSAGRQLGMSLKGNCSRAVAAVG